MTVPERLDDTRRVIVIRCTNCGEPWHDGHETTCETVDPALSGNDDHATESDPVMQWGVRWADGRVDTQANQEAARLYVDYWNGRGVKAELVTRICSPWSAS